MRSAEAKLASIEAICDEIDTEALRSDGGYVDGVLATTERIREIIQGG